MQTLSISQKVIKKGVVLLSREEYAYLLRLSQLGAVMEKLPEGIREGLFDLRQGRVRGPFNSVAGLRKSLEQ